MHVECVTPFPMALQEELVFQELYALAEYRINICSYQRENKFLKYYESWNGDSDVYHLYLLFVSFH